MKQYGVILVRVCVKANAHFSHYMHTCSSTFGDRARRMCRALQYRLRLLWYGSALPHILMIILYGNSHPASLLIIQLCGNTYVRYTFIVTGKPKLSFCYTLISIQGGY